MRKLRIPMSRPLNETILDEDLQVGFHGARYARKNHN